MYDLDKSSGGGGGLGLTGFTTNNYKYVNPVVRASGQTLNIMKGVLYNLVIPCDFENNPGKLELVDAAVSSGQVGTPTS